MVSMQGETAEKTFNDVGQLKLESAKMGRNKIGSFNRMIAVSN